MNGTVSNNSQWAGKNYNVEKVTGARIAIGQKFADDWKATLTYSYQRQLTHGAWDEDPTIGGAVVPTAHLVNGPVRSFGQNNVCASARNSSSTTRRRWTFISEGDVGIGDLVTPTPTGRRTTLGERVLGIHAVREHGSALESSPRHTGRAFTCQTDPIYSTGVPPNTARRTAAATYRFSITTTPQTSTAGPTSCACNRRKAAGFTGWSVRTGRRPATSTATTTHMPGCRPTGVRPGSTTTITTARRHQAAETR